MKQRLHIQAFLCPLIFFSFRQQAIAGGYGGLKFGAGFFEEVPDIGFMFKLVLNNYVRRGLQEDNSFPGCT